MVKGNFSDSYIDEKLYHLDSRFSYISQRKVLNELNETRVEVVKNLLQSKLKWGREKKRAQESESGQEGRFRSVSYRLLGVRLRYPGT